VSNATTTANAFAKSDTAKTPKAKATAEATSQTLLEVNGDRVEFTVANPGGQDVWVALGPEAVKEEGVWLKKEAGVYTNTTYTGIVSFCTTESTSLVTFVEV
jgi:hypothetical protein